MIEPFTIEDRILAIREKLELSQEEFGERIGVTKSTISLLERKLRNPSERVIRDICREFNINEEWLRNGVGGEDNMFINVTPQEKAYNRFGYIMENAAPSKKAALSVLLEMLYSIPDEQWDLMMEQFEEIKKEG
mgnify:CR=1 FL=1